MSERLRPWRSSVSPEEKELVDIIAAGTHNLLLLRSSGPTSFLVQNRRTKQTSKVSIGSLVSCSCTKQSKKKRSVPRESKAVVESKQGGQGMLDAESKAVDGAADEDGTTSTTQRSVRAPQRTRTPALCIHVLFVMLKKFGLASDNPLAYQMSFLDREISDLLAGRCCKRPHAPPAERKQRPSRLKRSSKDQSRGEACAYVHEQRAVGDGEVCAFCLEAFVAPESLEARLDNAVVTHCTRQCGGAFHATCMMEFVEHAMQHWAPRQTRDCPAAPAGTRVQAVSLPRYLRIGRSTGSNMVSGGVLLTAAVAGRQANSDFRCPLCRAGWDLFQVQSTALQLMKGAWRLQRRRGAYADIFQALPSPRDLYHASFAFHWRQQDRLSCSQCRKSLFACKSRPQTRAGSAEDGDGAVPLHSRAAARPEKSRKKQPQLVPSGQYCCFACLFCTEVRCFACYSKSLPLRHELRQAQLPDLTTFQHVHSYVQVSPLYFALPRDRSLMRWPDGPRSKACDACPSTKRAAGVICDEKTEATANSTAASPNTTLTTASTTAVTTTTSPSTTTSTTCTDGAAALTRSSKRGVGMCPVSRYIACYHRVKYSHRLLDFLYNSGRYRSGLSSNAMYRLPLFRMRPPPHAVRTAHPNDHPDPADTPSGVPLFHLPRIRGLVWAAKDRPDSCVQTAQRDPTVLRACMEAWNFMLTVPVYYARVQCVHNRPGSSSFSADTPGSPSTQDAATLRDQLFRELQYREIGPADYELLRELDQRIDLSSGQRATQRAQKALRRFNAEGKRVSASSEQSEDALRAGFGLVCGHRPQGCADCGRHSPVRWESRIECRLLPEQATSMPQYVVAMFPPFSRADLVQGGSKTPADAMCGGCGQLVSADALADQSDTWSEPEPFADKYPVRRLACGHCIHSECLAMHLHGGLGTMQSMVCRKCRCPVFPGLNQLQLLAATALPTPPAADTPAARRTKRHSRSASPHKPPAARGLAPLSLQGGAMRGSRSRGHGAAASGHLFAHQHPDHPGSRLHHRYARPGIDNDPQSLLSLGSSLQCVQLQTRRKPSPVMSSAPLVGLPASPTSSLQLSSPPVTSMDSASDLAVLSSQVRTRHGQSLHSTLSPHNTAGHSGLPLAPSHDQLGPSMINNALPRNQQPLDVGDANEDIFGRNNGDIKMAVHATGTSLLPADHGFSRIPDSMLSQSSSQSRPRSTQRSSTRTRKTSVNRRRGPVSTMPTRHNARKRGQRNHSSSSYPTSNNPHISQSRSDPSHQTHPRRLQKQPALGSEGWKMTEEDIDRDMASWLSAESWGGGSGWRHDPVTGNAQPSSSQPGRGDIGGSDRFKRHSALPRRGNMRTSQPRSEAMRGVAGRRRDPKGVSTRARGTTTVKRRTHDRTSGTAGSTAAHSTVNTAFGRRAASAQQHRPRQPSTAHDVEFAMAGTRIQHRNPMPF